MTVLFGETVLRSEIKKEKNLKCADLAEKIQKEIKNVVFLSQTDFILVSESARLELRRTTPQYPHTGGSLSTIDRVEVEIICLEETARILIKVTWKEAFLKYLLLLFIVLMLVIYSWPLHITLVICMVFLLFIPIFVLFHQILNGRNGILRCT